MEQRTDRWNAYDEHGDESPFRDEGSTRPRRSEQSPGRRRAPEPAPKRGPRTLLIATTALAVVGGGTLAAVESGVLRDKQSTPTAAATSPAPTTGSAAGSTAPADHSTPTASAPQTTTPGLSAPVPGAAAGEFYEAVQRALDPSDAVKTAVVQALFETQSQSRTYWSAAAKPTAAALCGAKAPTLAVVETPTASSVRVDLFQAGELAPKAASVALDKAGKIASIKCVPAAMPSYPGLPAILATYGKDKIPDKPFPPAHPTAPTSQDAKAPNDDAAWNTCAQYQPRSWVFYAPIPTAGGTAWRFAYNQFDFPVRPDLFVEQSGGIERVICEGLPSVPAADAATGGTPGGTSGGDPAHLLVNAVVQAYARERSLLSAGAQPAAEVEPYFASDAVFQDALSGTGKVPLLCTDQDPFNVAAKDGGPVTAVTDQVTVTVHGRPTDGNAADGPVIGQAVYTVDRATMKISSVTCL